MKKILFNISIAWIFIFSILLNAQEQHRKYTEKFTVKPTVTIDIDTRYTDIEIETWNKNEVIIEAYMSIEGEAELQKIEDYFEKWNFKAIGNKSEINIISKTANFIDINSFDFDTPDYSHIASDALQYTSDNIQDLLPEITGYNFDFIDSLDFDFSDFEMSTIPSLAPLIIDLENKTFDIFTMEKFDFKKHKKDKNYLKKWKERNKEALKGYDVKIGKNSISMSTNKDAISKEELKKRLERNVKRLKKQQNEIEKRKESMQQRLNERKKEKLFMLSKRKKLAKNRKEIYAKRRLEVRDILEKREKVKIKRIIKIKAPKDARFTMNVAYGSVRFPN